MTTYMAMAFQLHKPPLLSAALLLVCLLLLPCTCSASDSDQSPLGSNNKNLTVSGAFHQLPGYLFLTNMRTCRTNWQRVVGGLASYINKHPALDLSQKGWFFVRQHIVLSEDHGEGGLHEASFSVAFTLSNYQPSNQTKAAKSSLVFALEPLFFPVETWGMFTPPNWQVLGPSSSSNPTSVADGGAGSSRVSVEIGTEDDNGTLLHLGNIIWVQISIEPSSWQHHSSAAGKHSVWIDYDHVRHRMSVYVAAGEEAPKPAHAIASKTLQITAKYALPGLFSSMGQLLQVHTWNSTVDGLPSFEYSEVPSEKSIILYSVLASVAATAITAVLAILYINSKYRRWKKEQDELTKIMQGIPGVPVHVDFTDIKKATKNFHESMKLGKGGFGAVYRCTLPAVASRAGGSMEVAVKKFIRREVKDRRYRDFLDEVSIINRLRHKNIVPLVGWSYNKGEPILIYEYMANGSLDQHIFRKGSACTQQQKDTSSLGKWKTRYDIARDIATGLHYVHHEHEPVVLHRDIKASNIMLDSGFHARLGDFGIACTVAIDKSSAVAEFAGTCGYIAPDYATSLKATRQTDIYAFGVLILEIVTGKKYGDVQPDDNHITDWIWRLHGEGKLLDAVDASLLAATAGVDNDDPQEAVDASLLAATAGEDNDDPQEGEGVADEARRLLLLGLACTNPNPCKRLSMDQVLQVINKVRAPPDVPLEKPLFVWPPQDRRSRNSECITARSNFDDGSSASTVEVALASLEQERPLSSATTTRGHTSVHSRATSGTQSCLEIETTGAAHER